MALAAAAGCFTVVKSETAYELGYVRGAAATWIDARAPEPGRPYADNRIAGPLSNPQTTERNTAADRAEATRQALGVVPWVLAPAAAIYGVAAALWWIFARLLFFRRR